MDLNKLRAPHLPIKPWDSDTALERRKILQVIFKPTISLVPVSLFCTVTCPPINRQQYYLDATTAAGNQLWIRSSGLPRRRGRVFTKLSTDTTLVFKRNDRRTYPHRQVYNLELGEVAPPAKNLLRFQLPAAAASKPAQKVIYNQGFGLKARFR